MCCCSALSFVWLSGTPWTATYQAYLFFIVSQSLLKLMSIELMMPSNHLILCCPFLLLPSIFPRIWIFSNDLTLCIRWPKYWSFSCSISPSNEFSCLIFFRFVWFDLLAVQGTLKSLLQHHSSKASILRWQYLGQCFFHSVILLPLVAMDDWFFMVSLLRVSGKTQFSPCKSFVLLKFGGWYIRWTISGIRYPGL